MRHPNRAVGTLPPSGKHFELDVSGVFRIAGRKIAELWMTWDSVAVLPQLGHLNLSRTPAPVVSS
jgi:predicted ester cyclase